MSVDLSLINKIQIGSLSVLDPSPLNNALREYLIACKVEGKSQATLSVYSQITKDSNTLTQIILKVEALTQVIEEQNKQLIYAQSWRAKLPGMLLGGLIGAVISLVLQLFL